VTNGYTNGLLTSVGSYATVTYRANGLVNTITHGSSPASVTETWVPDPSGMPRPARIEVTDANQSYWKFGDYAYDGAGNIPMIGNTTYQYDDVNRLRRHATWSGNKVYSATTYDYDRYGNRSGSWSDGCASNGRCFASLPSYLPIAATSNHNNTHTHDDSGSITSDGKYNFGYDATAMMTSLTGADGNAAHSRHGQRELRNGSCEPPRGRRHGQSVGWKGLQAGPEAARSWPAPTASANTECRRTSRGSIKYKRTSSRERQRKARGKTMATSI
jgi:hypothetical protein